MKAKELINIGYKQGPVIGLLLKACEEAKKLKFSAEDIRSIVKQIHENPSLFTDREIWKDVASELFKIRNPKETYTFTKKEYKVWGSDIEEEAIKQMERAMDLPISVFGAVMPDCHSGYGLPIGGVLATDNSVIPFAVGVDIACRMMLTVLPCDIKEIDSNENDFIEAIEKNTLFGVGEGFKQKKYHPVMDKDWSFSRIVHQVKDTAWEQLGTSGSGNHFLDIGEIEFCDGRKYVAILTHSGSRGAGAQIAQYYTKLAESLHPYLPPEYKRLAWLDMNKEEGQEYWKAMELMGEYASANHHLIHDGVLKTMKMDTVMQIENHHNFAWKEIHNGKEVIVHRKGATPAGLGIMGIIPGCMASPGFLVKGKGNLLSLNSASHGAGRAMSRKKAKETNRWSQVNGVLKQKKVKLISAGLDEVPNAYKNIHTVMSAQSDLVEVVAKFTPRIVKMSGDGESEDK